MHCLPCNVTYALLLRRRGLRWLRWLLIGGCRRSLPLRLRRVLWALSSFAWRLPILRFLRLVFAVFITFRIRFILSILALLALSFLSFSLSILIVLFLVLVTARALRS